MIRRYRLEWYQADGPCIGWHLISEDDGSYGLTWLRGYLAAVSRYESPRSAYRVVRDDGVVVEELPALNEVSVGMVLDWPSAAQYLRAAARAVRRSVRVRGGVDASAAEGMARALDLWAEQATEVEP